MGKESLSNRSTRMHPPTWMANWDLVCACVGCVLVWGVCLCEVCACVGCVLVWGVYLCGVCACVGCALVWGLCLCVV